MDCFTTRLARCFRTVLFAGVAAGVMGVATVPGAAGAADLNDALVSAYQTNPELSAARAALRATDEGVAQALSGWRPDLRITGSYGYEYEENFPGRLNNDFSDDDERNPSSVQLELTQPVFRGGRTLYGTRQAKNQVWAQRAVLDDTEQQVLVSAATAWLNVWRDKAVLDLNDNNVAVLERQLQASRDRFDVGEITLTDVAQSESRLARAVAERATAAGALEASRAVYEQVVGAPAPQMPETPVFARKIPASLEEAIAAAAQNNPDVIAARFAERAARDNVNVEVGDLLPEVSIVGTLRRVDEFSEFNDRQESASVTARMTVPIYQQGSQTSQVRQAKQLANQRAIEVRREEERVRQETISAWERWLSANATIEARQAEVDAAEIALEGVREEALVGSRTTLDVLDAEQESLDAAVNLLSAIRDAQVAGYQLLAAIGAMNAGALELDVAKYDPDSNYERVKWRIWGTGVGDLGQ